MFIPWNTYLEFKKQAQHVFQEIKFTAYNSGGTLCLIFSSVAIFWVQTSRYWMDYWIRCLKIIVFKYLAPKEGGRKGFRIRFLCKCIDELHILLFFSFSSHIASSCNITSVLDWCIKEVPVVEKIYTTCLSVNYIYRLKFKGVLMFDDPIFSRRNILSENKQILNGYWNKVSKNYRFQISRPWGFFHIRFTCKQSKQYVEFGI